MIKLFTKVYKQKDFITVFIFKASNIFNDLEKTLL